MRSQTLALVTDPRSGLLLCGTLKFGLRLRRKFKPKPRDNEADSFLSCKKRKRFCEMWPQLKKIKKKKSLAHCNFYNMSKINETYYYSVDDRKRFFSAALCYVLFGIWKCIFSVAIKLIGQNESHSIFESHVQNRVNNIWMAVLSREGSPYSFPK